MMDNRIRLTYWDRVELLETVKEFHQKPQGDRQEAGLCDESEIKALEGEIAELKGELIKKGALPNE